MLIVSDTTPIISLMKIGQLELLKRIFGAVVIPEAVHDELVRNSSYVDEAALIAKCGFLEVRHVAERRTVAELLRKERLDEGESEAIILAKEHNADVLLMDEKRGRRVAKKFNIKITGTVGVLLYAYDEGLLSGDEVTKCMECLLENNIRMSKSLHMAVKNHLNKGR